jgi:oligopeptide transport system permease protein
MARIVRGQVISLKNQEFILAARATGVPKWKIVLRHLVPNTLGPVIVYATLEVPAVIAARSFPVVSQVSASRLRLLHGAASHPKESRNIAVFPWQLIFPGVTMALTPFLTKLHRRRTA